MYELDNVYNVTIVYNDLQLTSHWREPIIKNERHEADSNPGPSRDGIKAL